MNTTRAALTGSVLVALAACIATALLWRENLALRAELALRGGAVADPAAPAVADVDDQAGAPVPREVVVGASSAPAVPAPVLVRDQPAGERGGGRDLRTERFARMMTDPAAREMMLSRIRSDIDRTYGDLFVKLGLNLDQVEMLRSLLAERQMARMQGGFLARSAEDDVARAEAEQWRDGRIQSIEAGINSLLGADGVEMIEDYQRTWPQRQAVEDIARRAAYAGAPLSESTSEQLLQLMKSVEAEMPVQDGGRWGPPANADNAVSTGDWLASLKARDEAVLARAQTLLTPQQLEALADRQLEEYREAELRANMRDRGVWSGGGGGRRGGGDG